MCLIIFAPAGSSIQSDWMKNAYTNNPDGAGLAYSDGNTVRIVKGLMTYEAFTEAYNAIPRAYPRLIHFRYATLGVINEDNTHPFWLDKSGSAVAHNGPCVSQAFKGDATRSDSRHLAEDLLSKLDEDTLMLLHPVLEDFIESGNKLAFLFANGTHMLVNEHLGKWQKGVWLSNTYSIAPRHYRSSSLYGGKNKKWSRANDFEYDDFEHDDFYGSLYSGTPTNSLSGSSGPTAFDSFKLIPVGTRGQDGGDTLQFYYDIVNDDWYCYTVAGTIGDFLLEWWDGKTHPNAISFTHTFDGLDDTLDDMFTEFGVLYEPEVKAATKPVATAPVSITSPVVALTPIYPPLGNAKPLAK